MLANQTVLHRLPLVLLTLASGTSAARASKIDVRLDAEILELHDAFSFTVVAERVDPPPFHVRVELGGVDVTSVVTVEPTEEIVDDVDRHGVLEDYSAEYRVAWNEIDLVAGDRVKVTVTATHPGGRESASGVASVVPHVEVIFGTPEEGEGRVVDVAVKIEEAEIVAQGVTVELDGVDITAQVRISGPTIADDVASGEDPAVTHYRLEGFVVDFQTVTLEVDDRLRVTVEVTTPLGVTSSSSVVPVAPPANLTPAQQAAVDTFIEKLKIVDDPNHPGALCLGATADEIKDAADELQAAVGEDFPAGQKKVESDGRTVTIEIGTGGGGTVSAHGGSTSQVTVAIGGDGTGTSNGQNAKAISTGAGTIAIAVGGDATGGGKKGGFGDATSAGENSGTAAGLGGNGTTGAEGGHGVAKVGDEGGGKTLADDGKGGITIAGKDDASGNLGSGGS
ncbi:MAG: hypothetical protein ACF8XB_05240 [Planctomycetota bacterium JB042]